MILNNETVPAGKEIAKALNMEEGSRNRVKRLREAKGMPLYIEAAHLVYGRCPEAFGRDFAKESLRKF